MYRVDAMCKYRDIFSTVIVQYGISIDIFSSSAIRYIYCCGSCELCIEATSGTSDKAIL